MLSNHIENKDLVARQINQIMCREKVSGVKENIVEKIENYIKNTEKKLFIAEIPNLIKNNSKCMSKYNKIKEILAFF